MWSLPQPRDLKFNRSSNYSHIGGDKPEISMENVYVEPWQVVGELGKVSYAYGVSLGEFTIQLDQLATVDGHSRWLAITLVHEKLLAARLVTIKSQLSDSGVCDRAACGALDGLECVFFADQGQTAVKELSMTKAYSV